MLTGQAMHAHAHGRRAHMQTETGDARAHGQRRAMCVHADRDAEYMQGYVTYEEHTRGRAQMRYSNNNDGGNGKRQARMLRWRRSKVRSEGHSRRVGGHGGGDGTM